MSDQPIRVDGVTIAVDNLEQMARFYREVFGAELYPVAMGPAQLYVGTMAGLDLQLCPKVVAGVSASDNVHQLRFAVRDLAGLLVTARAAGGTLLGDVVQTGNKRVGAVRDPDGNSIELVQVDKAP